MKKVSLFEAVTIVTGMIVDMGLKYQSKFGNVTRRHNGVSNPVVKFYNPEGIKKWRAGMKKVEQSPLALKVEFRKHKVSGVMSVIVFINKKHITE